MATDTYNSPGSYSWTAPFGQTVTLEVRGAGGGDGGRGLNGDGGGYFSSGGNGGTGGYVSVDIYVSGGETLSVVVPDAGDDGEDGNDTSRADNGGGGSGYGDGTSSTSGV